MQQSFLFYVLRTSILIYLAAIGTGWAEESSNNEAKQSLPILDSPYQYPSETSVSEAEFEGHYKVGKTSCSVVPVKMAFEVKWKKGRGVMHFFFDTTTPDGKTIFVSKDLGKGRDQFVFDDNAYNSGIFIRADGKTFKVERLSK
jgi:hypothetical protein